MKGLFAIMALVWVLGVSQRSAAPLAPPESPATERASASSPALGDDPGAICPRRWTCDAIHYYSARSACAATACGAACYVDADCNGSCTCP
jgi:hypothetical protein